MISDIILYTILGFLGFIALVLLIAGIKDGTLIKETEEQRRQREERQAARKRRRASSWYEEEKSFDRMNNPDSLDDENLDMFGYPMDED